MTETVFCCFEDEFGGVCSKEAQHFYRFKMNELAPGKYSSRCEEHHWKNPDPTLEVISEHEYIVGQIMDS